MLQAKKGQVKMVMEIVEQEWLDPLTLLNLKGQNILHITSKNGKHRVVSYILREMKLEKLLNEREKEWQYSFTFGLQKLISKGLVAYTR